MDAITPWLRSAWEPKRDGLVGTKLLLLVALNFEDGEVVAKTRLILGCHFLSVFSINMDVS